MSLLNDLVIDNTKRLQGKSIKKVPKHIHDQRKAICDDCDWQRLTKIGKIKFCEICGCSTDDKTEYADESCPDDPKRWLKYHE